MKKYLLPLSIGFSSFTHAGSGGWVGNAVVQQYAAINKHLYGPDQSTKFRREGVRAPVSALLTPEGEAQFSVGFAFFYSQEEGRQAAAPVIGWEYGISERWSLRGKTFRYGLLNNGGTGHELALDLDPEFNMYNMSSTYLGSSATLVHQYTRSSLAFTNTARVGAYMGPSPGYFWPEFELSSGIEYAVSDSVKVYTSLSGRIDNQPEDIGTIDLRSSLGARVGGSVDLSDSVSLNTTVFVSTERTASATASVMWNF